MKLSLALAVALLAASCASSTPAVSPTPSPVVKPAPGDHIAHFKDSQGTVRKYLVHAPPSYTDGKAYPLVLIFHGSGGKAEDMVTTTGINALADTEDFLVVYPHETSVPQAVGELIDHLSATWSVDPKRVHAAGFSRGATAIYDLARRLPGRFGSVAPVSGSGQGDTPLPKPVSLITFQGGVDRLAQAWPRTNNDWAKAAVCSGEQVTTITMEGGPTHIYTSQCTGGTEHVVYAVARMGHEWPADANKLMWEFFTRHPLP